MILIHAYPENTWALCCFMLPSHLASAMRPAGAGRADEDEVDVHHRSIRQRQHCTFLHAICHLQVRWIGVGGACPIQPCMPAGEGRCEPAPPSASAATTQSCQCSCARTNPFSLNFFLAAGSGFLQCQVTIKDRRGTHPGTTVRLHWCANSLLA